MADFTAQTYSVTTSELSQNIQTATTFPVPTNSFSRLTQGILRRFKMRWLDVDALPTVTYRTWDVTDEPDPTGVHYTGPKSGSTPISGATIEERRDS